MRIEGNKFTFRQSGLNTFFQCPEKARQEWFLGVREEEPSDAAATGTALHSMIEADLAPVSSWTVPSAVDYAHFKFDQLVEEGVRFVQSDMDHARTYLTNMTEAWCGSDLRATLLADRARLLLEWNFNVCLDVADDGRELWLEGQADCLRVMDHHVSIRDWKTAAQAYKPWEKRRWAKQPTVYTYAAWTSFPAKQVRPTFEYVVFSKQVNKCDMQQFEVQRDETHWDWLRRQLWAIVDMNPEKTWPLVDEDPLCSGKFCPVWSQCKGSLVTL